MTRTDLMQAFSDTREKQSKAIFHTLFIASNQLQTLFDQHIPELSLKQFILLSTIRQAREPLTITQTGALLGCSRQNVKKIAKALEQKGFLQIRPGHTDLRVSCLCVTEQGEDFFKTTFSVYQEELAYLFEAYTAKETETLFRLLMKLYDGIDRLAKAVDGKPVQKKEKAHE